MQNGLNHVWMLVGTKLDQVEEMKILRQVSKDEAQAFADKLGIPYWEVSAKSGKNIKEMFEDLQIHLINAEEYRFISRIIGTYVNIKPTI